MPLTGALQADFSAFVTEATKASAALGVMEAEAKKTGTTLAKTGQAVDGVASSGAGLKQLSAGLRTVDQSANALGFSLSKPIGLIDELGQVAGKTTTELGALGTAGAAAGAALAGWNLGRWVADLTGSDEVIGRWVANLLGTGDAAQVAAYKQEVLAKASATAKRTITDLSEAMTINYNAVAQHTAAVDTATHRQALWEREIRAHRAQLPDMLAALENHTASVKDLAREYQMTEGAITYYVAKTKDQTAAQAAATRETEAAAAAQQKLRDQLFGGDTITKAQEYQQALGGLGNLAKVATDEQAKLNTVVGAAIDAYTRAGAVAPQAMRDLYLATIPLPPVVAGLGSEWASVGETVNITADAVVADTKRMAAEANAYEQETQDLVQAYIDMQYGAGAATGAIRETTGAQQQLTVALQNFGTVAQSAYEKAIAGAQLYQAYAEAGVATGGSIGLSGYQFKQLQQTGVPGGLAAPLWANAAPASAQPWGNQNTLTVNVNNASADQIASKLVTEMRHSGVRLG